MSRLIVVDVVCQSPLVGHELLPANITRVSGLQANRPVSDRHLDGSPTRSGSASARILLPTAVDIGPSIGGILKDIANPRTIGFPPDHIVRRRSEQRSNRQRQSTRTQEAHDTACALQLPELGKDQEQTRLHFFIGIEDDRACAVMSEPGGQRQAQFAPCRLLALTLMKAHPDLVKLCLAHDAGQAQQQAIVIGAADRRAVRHPR